MFIVKQHKDVLAVCDANIFGKKYEEGNLQLDLTSEFYDGEKVDEKRVIELLSRFGSINFVGEKSIKIGIEKGFIGSENIIKIKDIPHAICLNIV